MNYRDAVSKKDKINKVTFKDSKGIEYVYMVVPKTFDYFIEYREAYIYENKNNSTFFDDDAVGFAKDNEFKYIQ